MKKKDALYISILMIFPLLLIYVLLGQDHTFGHTVDWLNQHVMISDALRYAMQKIWKNSKLKSINKSVLGL